MQADGRDDLGVGANQGDATDLFRLGLNARLASDTTPSSRWWDGTFSNLDIHDVGPDGQDMTFMAKL